MTGEIKQDETTPKRFSAVAAIFLATVAASQGARIYYALDVQVGSFHVPMGVSWGIAIVFGLVSIFAFREAES